MGCIRASEKNITSIPVAKPIPYTRLKLANVPLMLIGPLLAELPTADILANTGMTTNRTAKAIRAKRGTIISPMFSLLHQPDLSHILSRELVLPNR